MNLDNGHIRAYLGSRTISESYTGFSIPWIVFRVLCGFLLGGLIFKFDVLHMLGRHLATEWYLQSRNHIHVGSTWQELPWLTPHRSGQKKT